MATKAVLIGPTARRVADNVERIRKARRLNQKELADLMEEVGLPMQTTVVSKTERGERRIDVDDLVALALALNVSPLTLLFPPTANDERVDLTESYAVTSSTAWAWGMGRQTAMDWEPGGVIDVTDDPSSLAVSQEYEREQEFGRRETAFRELAEPEELRRAGNHPTFRLAQVIAGLIEDLVTLELGTPPQVVETWSRMARRRVQQLLIELDDIDERIANHTYPGVSYPLEAKLQATSAVGATGRVIPGGRPAENTQSGEGDSA